MSRTRLSDSVLTITRQKDSRWLAALFRGSRKRRRRATARIDPGLECLEDRLLLTHGPADIHQSAAFSESQVVSDSPIGSNFSTTADIDGDGDLDVLATSSADDVLRWFENLGNGAFDEHLIANNTDALHAQVADLDGDGDADLVVAATDDNSIAWFENDGQQNFSAHVISTDAPAVLRVAVADMDGDGDLDVLSASYQDNTVAWYENDGAENFTRRIIDTNSGRSVVAVDLDGDGDVDVITSTRDTGEVLWFENDGSQQFTRHIVGDNANPPRNISAVDLDGDGDLDIVPARLNNSQIWYENDGDENFTERQIPRADGVNYGQWTVDPADLDNDGDIDLLVAMNFAGADGVVWLENDGNSNFTEHLIEPDYVLGLYAHTADLDNDGDLDVVAVDPQGQTVTWHENRGGQFSLHTERIIGQIDDGRRTVNGSAAGANSASSLDFDGDGDRDILSTSSNGTIAWYENTGAEQFVERSVSPTFTNVINLFSVDVDGDHALDVVALGGSGNRALSWFRNDGSQGFSEFRISDLPANPPQDLFVTDLDQDSDVDLLLAYSNQIFWFENDGTGSFTTHMLGPSKTGINSVTATDLDGDGDTDVVAGTSVSAEIFWFENDGNQGFSAQTISSTAFLISEMTTADVDGDGDMDLLTHRSQAQIVWYENDGNQVFQQRVVDDTERNPNSVLAADIDGDGDVDFAASFDFGHQVVWYENDGTQTFVKHIVDATRLSGISRDNHGSIFADDVDGDGDLDLLSTSRLNDSIFWYENFGDGEFSFEPPANVAAGATVGVLKVTLTHEGRPGDDDVELATLDLQFDNGAGALLSSAQANALIDTLHLFVDSNQNGRYDAGLDALVTSAPTLNLDTHGRMTLVVPDGVPEAAVAPEGSKAFFVVVETTVDADLQTPSSFRITHLTQSSSTAENRQTDGPLQMEFVADVSSAVLLFTDEPPVPPVVTPPPRTTITNSEIHIADSTPTFVFEEVNGADHYELALYSQTLGRELQTVIIAGTQFTSAPLPDDTYEVYVRGINTAGTALWSDPYVFTLYSAGPGDAPVIYGPTGPTDDNTPTIAWQDVAGRIDYELVVYSVDRGVEVSAATHVEHTYFTTPQLAIGETYEVYVRARFAGDALTSWSPMHRFSVVPESPPTFIATPIQTANIPPVFLWTGAKTADSYTLLVYNVDTGREVERIAAIDDNSVQLANPYAGATLEAYVRIETASGSGRWSAPIRVKTLATMADRDVDAKLDLDHLLEPIDDPAGDATPDAVDDSEAVDREVAAKPEAISADDIEHLDAALAMWDEIDSTAAVETA